MANPSNRSPSPRLLAATLMAVLVLLSMDGARVAEAVTCNAVELSSCLSAVTSSAAPLAQCCSKLREQRPCLCGYIRDPNLQQYVANANAKQVARTCGVAYPTC